MTGARDPLLNNSSPNLNFAIKQLRKKLESSDTPDSERKQLKFEILNMAFTFAKSPHDRPVETLYHLCVAYDIKDSAEPAPVVFYSDTLYREAAQSGIENELSVQYGTSRKEGDVEFLFQCYAEKFSDYIAELIYREDHPEIIVKGLSICLPDKVLNEILKNEKLKKKLNNESTAETKKETELDWQDGLEKLVDSSLSDKEFQKKMQDNLKSPDFLHFVGTHFDSASPQKTQPAILLLKRLKNPDLALTFYFHQRVRLKDGDTILRSYVIQRPALCIAAGRGHQDAVKDLIQIGARSSISDKKSNFLKDMKEVSIDIKCSSRLEKDPTVFPEQPLSVAAMALQPGVIDQLLKYPKVDPTEAFYYLSESFETEKVKSLNPSLAEEKYSAVRVQIAKSLLKAGACPQAVKVLERPESAHHVLFDALRAVDVDFVELLLPLIQDARLLLRYIKDGTYAPDLSSHPKKSADFAKIVKLLINKLCDLKVESVTLKESLFWMQGAVAKIQDEAISCELMSWLLDHGANLNMGLFHAIDRVNYPVMLTCIQKGATILNSLTALKFLETGFVSNLTGIDEDPKRFEYMKERIQNTHSILTYFDTYFAKFIKIFLEHLDTYPPCSPKMVSDPTKVSPLEKIAEIRPTLCQLQKFFMTARVERIEHDKKTEDSGEKVIWKNLDECINNLYSLMGALLACFKQSANVKAQAQFEQFLEIASTEAFTFDHHFVKLLSKCNQEPMRCLTVPALR